MVVKSSDLEITSFEVIAEHRTLIPRVQINLVTVTTAKKKGPAEWW